MRKAVSTLVTATIVSVGLYAGEWLWKEVLRDQAIKLKDRLNNKSEEDKEL